MCAYARKSLRHVTELQVMTTDGLSWDLSCNSQDIFALLDLSCTETGNFYQYFLPIQVIWYQGFSHVAKYRSNLTNTIKILKQYKKITGLS